ncbi:MAG TPA: PDZ domain-containing protein [Candidatus Binataceae bacterium]|nr:PDZ domain-containing protein [Candidatus Binataceae bacterium]
MALSEHRRHKTSRHILWITLLLEALMIFDVEPRWALAATRCESQPLPPEVGSIEDYVGKAPGIAEASLVSRVGLVIIEGEARLASGQKLAGLQVIAVEQPSAADDAGIKSEGVSALTAAEQLGVGIAVIGAMLAFPPALFGAAMVPRLNWKKSHDVIVAVDSERTRNICELEASLRKARAGDPIYLTLIREGRRKQVRVAAPSDFDPLH